MNEMVERVAKSIWAATLWDRVYNEAADRFDWDHNVEDKDSVLRIAAAAVSAMREPTPGMMASADAKIPSGFHFGIKDGDLHGCRIIWHAMIDEALK